MINKDPQRDKHLQSCVNIPFGTDPTLYELFTNNLFGLLVRAALEAVQAWESGFKQLTAFTPGSMKVDSVEVDIGRSSLGFCRLFVNLC